MNIYRTTFLFIIILLPSFWSCKPASTKINNDLTMDSGSSLSDTLHFQITEGNNLKFSCFLNEQDSINLYFDTGGTDVVMLYPAIKNRTSLLKGRNENYSEEAFEPLEELNSLAIGSLSWDSLTIFPAPIGPEEMDGHFGWDLFDDKVVELDYETQELIVHSKLPIISPEYVKMEIEYVKTLFCIKSIAEVKGKQYKNRYLFDSGFQRAIVMDRDLRAEADFPKDLPVLKESVLRNSEGVKFVNKIVSLDKVCFEDLCIEEVPVHLISTPNPARFKTHILGGELLKRFNTILDFQNDYVYLKTNNLTDLPYADAS